MEITNVNKLIGIDERSGLKNKVPGDYLHFLMINKKKQFRTFIG